MTKILSTLAIHRLLLFGVALFSIYQSLPPDTPHYEKTFGNLTQRFFRRVQERPATRALVQRAYSYPGSFWESLQTPFLSIYRGFLRLTRLPPLTGLILLTNLFFFLFLLEFYGLWGRSHPADEAARAATLVVLLPTSFEMSLVSSFSFTCFLVALTVHRAMTNRWLVSGIALGILTLIDPLNAVLVPLMLYIFFYYHQGQVFKNVWKRALLFLAPVIVAIFLDYRSFGMIGDSLKYSTFSYLVSSISGEGLGQTLAHSPIGTSIIIIVLVVGAVGAFLNNKSFIDKILPASMLIFVLLTSPFSRVGFRVPLAGLCLHGVIQLTGRPTVWILYAILFVMGAMEIAGVFRGA